MWADEAGDYDYRTNRCKSGAQCGHYTQIVWADTQRVGCGVATCNMLGTRGQFVVCDYEPPGNFVGQKPY
jgi:pathogenesis-related protein 1